MEEKKDNKTILIILIVCLVVCLIGIIIFLLPIIKGKEGINQSTNDNTSEIINNNDQMEFTELNRYTLQEGEEKEVIIAGKKIVLKKNNNEIYLNDVNVGRYTYIYLTNKFIICSKYNESNYESFGVIYDLNLNQVEINKNNLMLRFDTLNIENGKLLIDAIDITGGYHFDGFQVENILIGDCENLEKSIKEIEEELKKYEDIALEAIYEIKYENNEIKLNVEKVIETVKDRIERSGEYLCFKYLD